MCACVCVRTINKKETINLKKRNEEYIRGFEGKKVKGDMVHLEKCN